MPEMKQISSPQNPLIKQLEKLQKARERKKQDRCVVEGFREIKRAVLGGHTVVALLFCAPLIQKEEMEDLAEAIPAALWNEVHPDLFSKLSYRKSDGGFLALVQPKRLSLNTFQFNAQTPVVAILEGIEKPGNIGAMLRTADALGVDLVMLTEPTTDLFNPNVIRSSLGGVFTRAIVSCSNQEALSFCRQHRLNVVATYLHTATLLTQVPLNQPTALVFGSEANGITDFWKANAHFLAKLPMHGIVDSLNVSVAFALVNYEFFRQTYFTAQGQ